MPSLSPYAVDDPAARMDRLEAICRTSGSSADRDTAACRVAEHLADPDPGVRDLAARLLADMAAPAAAAAVVPFLGSPDITLRNLAAEVLARMGESAVEALSPVVDDTDKDLRKLAIDVLALLPAEAAVPAIAGRLHDDDPNVVLAAVDALGALGAVEYAPALRDLYAAMPLARPNIVAALGSFRLPQDLLLLETALVDADLVVGLAAAEALSGQRAPEILDLLLRRIGNVHPMARSIVLHSIVALCREHPDRIAGLPAGLRPFLIEMIDDPEEAYGFDAVQALGWMLDEPTVDELLAHTGQTEALDAAVFGTLSTYPDLYLRIIDAADERRMPAATAATFILALLARGLVSPDETHKPAIFLRAYYPALDLDTKLAMIDLALRLDHASLHPLLCTGLSDPDPTVRSFAADAAEALGLVCSSPPDRIHAFAR